MRISEAFPSKYLKAADLQIEGVYKEYELLIESCYMEDISAGDDAPIMKPVLRLESESGQKLEKAIVLNKTNSNVIAAAYGDETDAWPGKRVIIYAADVQFKSDTVKAIRIRIPAEKADPDTDGIPF